MTSRLFQPLVISAAAAVTLAMLNASQSHGTLRRVPADYSTIDAGIFAAQPGDTVLVARGTYSGPGNRNLRLYGKAIVLMSEEGPEQTILDIQADVTAPARGFLIDGSETAASVVDGFTIINGFISDSSERTAADDRHAFSGGGMSVTFQSHPTIRNMIVRNCHSDFTGGGIAIESDSEPTLTRCVIQDCTAEIQGGGVSIEARATPILEACVITGNRSVIGGGVACDSNPFTGPAPSFVDCTIAGNFAEDRGGGIFCFAKSKSRLERVVVWGNCAGESGSSVFVEPFSQAAFACSVIDSSEVRGEGQVEFAEDNVMNIAPGFCAPDSCTSAPTATGDYGVEESSPCLAHNSPCGARIGGIGRGGCAIPEPVVNTSWGKLKNAMGKSNP